jgi:uncharacterized integral membrane protein
VHVFRKLIWTLLAFPAAAILIALAVANRHSVVMKLDPFKPEAPAIALNLPLYAYLFGALFAGIVLGGVASWLGQGKWRRRVKDSTVEAARWRSEASRFKREVAAMEAANKNGLPAPATTESGERRLLAS